jgi:hypothetical protein
VGVRVDGQVRPQRENHVKAFRMARAITVSRQNQTTLIRTSRTQDTYRGPGLNASERAKSATAPGLTRSRLKTFPPDFSTQRMRTDAATPNTPPARNTLFMRANVEVTGAQSQVRPKGADAFVRPR